MEHESFEGTLPDAFIESLFIEFDIPAVNTSLLKSQLNEVCGRFVQRRKEAANLGSVSDQHKELQRIASEVAKLSAFLETIKEPYQDILESASYYDNERDYYLKCEDYEADYAYDGHLDKPYRPPERADSFLNVQTLRRQAYFLADAAEYIRQFGLGKQKTGPQGNRYLDVWIEDIRNFWCISLSRDFTRDELNGVATSKAARFCVAVFAELSPETPEKTVLNAMKKRIKADRQNAHWRN
ncbi:hypothetical protein [Neptunicoccus cionae]|uniref:hypothetical protein n=1 Tax=Neptunicoccus cionae TaxID=2035344 RepID=UPI000C77F878|nr:hypothetical protein [Amylibacter cionae]PLS19844.1 hypothetical protein C0U40_19625 [Amylibacter cionae]